MDQFIAPQQPLQQQVPVATMPDMPQPLAPQTPRKTPLLVITLIVIVLVSGSYAGAAFYFKLWPFQGASLNKQLAFAGLFSKMQGINSASYEATLGVKAEPREANATAFEPASFPEFEAETKMYQNDQNRVRDINRIQLALGVYTGFSTPAYPGSLVEVAELKGMDIHEYSYGVNAAADDYTLMVTLETDAAVKSMQNQVYAPEAKKATQFNVKTVTLSKNSGINFYFYGEPQKPYWARTLEDGGDSYFEFAPSDFTFNLRIGGTSQKNQNKAADANFHLGGDATFGDFNVAADVELRKKGDTYYGEITKFPSLFLDLSAIKNKWVKVTPEDLISYGDLPYIASFVGDKQKKNNKALEQIQTLFKTMDEDKVLSVDFSLPDEMIGKEAAYVYAVSYDETKVVPWYEHLSKVMKDTYGDDAMIKLDENSLRYMKSESFQKYLAYIKNNTTMHIVVDKKTGFPVRIDYRFRLAPSAKVAKLKDKQFSMNLALALSNINAPVVVEEPKDAISFEDAQIALTGQTHEEYQFYKQKQNVYTIQSALNGYHTYTGVYPDTLDQLTTPRGELTKAPVKPATTTGGIQIDFPENFSGFSDQSWGSEYEKKLAETPFLKTIPKDIFTKAPYLYAKGADTEDFTLKYSMTIPPRNKEAVPSGGGGFRYSQSFNVNDAIAFVGGMNTATAKVLSTEAKAALESDADSDDLPDIVETYYGSDLTKKDTDGDGYSDGDEVRKGYDPAGPGKLGYGDTWYPPYKPPVYDIQPQPSTSSSIPACKLEGQAVSASEKCCYGSENKSGICVKAKPDLRITSIVPAGTAFKVTVCNDGKANAIAPSFTTVANGKTSKLIVPDITSGACDTSQTWGYSYFGIPEKWSGDVEATADKDNSILESNEMNNTLKMKVEVSLSFGCAEGSVGAGTPYFYSPEPSSGQAAIVITAPKQGTVLERNKPYIITWETKNFTAKKVNIYLDDLCGSSSFIAAGITNEGNFPWNVDTVDPISLAATSMPVPTTKYLLMITSNSFDNDAGTQVIGRAGYITIK